MKESKWRLMYYDAMYCLSIVILFIWFHVHDMWKYIKKRFEFPVKTSRQDEHLHDWEDWL